MLLLWKRELVPDVYGGHLSGVEKVCESEKIPCPDGWSGPYVDDWAICQPLSRGSPFVLPCGQSHFYGFRLYCQMLRFF